MTIDTTNMCSHLQRKLFEEDGIYHSLWIAMQDDPELTAVVRSRQLHIYRNGIKAASKREQSDAGIDSAEHEQARPKVKVLVLAGKSAPKIIREDSICELLQIELPNSANTMAVSCGNWTLLLTKQGIFLQTSNAEYYQKMVFGICSLTIVKFKRKSKNDSRLHCHRL